MQWCRLAAPVDPPQPVHGAFVLPEASILFEAKTEALVEALSPNVLRQRIEQDRFDSRCGEAAFERELHHACAEALAQVVGFTNPHVDGPEIVRAAAPVMAVLTRRIDDLHEANRA